MGEIVPVAWVPRAILPDIGGWRGSLAFWAIPVLATALLVFVLVRQPDATGAPVAGWWPEWRDGRVWRCGLLLGGVNAVHFGLNGFLPGWLAATGRPSLVQPSLVAVNLAQLPASLLLWRSQADRYAVHSPTAVPAFCCWPACWAPA